MYYVNELMHGYYVKGLIENLGDQKYPLSGTTGNKMTDNWHLYYYSTSCYSQITWKSVQQLQKPWSSLVFFIWSNGWALQWFGCCWLCRLVSPFAHFSFNWSLLSVFWRQAENNQSKFKHLKFNERNGTLILTHFHTGVPPSWQENVMHSCWVFSYG